MHITQEMMEALADLRNFEAAVKEERNPSEIDKNAALAVGLLDDENFFQSIDEAEYKQRTGTYLLDTA